MKNFFKYVIVCFTLTLVPTGAHAGAKSFGLTGGWGFTTNKDLPTPKWNAGASFDMMLGTNSSLGFFGAYQTTEAIASGFTTTFMPIGATLNFYLGKAPGFYIGANGGMLRMTIKSSSGSLTGSDYFVGGQAGLDLPIGKSTSIGAEGKYLYVLSDPAFGFILAQANLKFWF